MGFQIVCVNAANKPAEYPSTDSWLKQGQVYTPIKVAYLIDGNIGVQIEEITPSEENPFQYFNLNRFAVPEEFLEWAKEQLENQEGSGPEIDFEKLVNQEELI